ncbi:MULTISPECIES: accessory gene regulator B family protein [Clostridium]|uniref:Accessory regulator AgrB n=1 Tax=Clostridium beijerinckii TaxID=1520 RepID=A0A1S9NDD3_CLOBE|nr:MULTISPECIES: accessory gene regulator B family protein [Clostridium]MBN7577119.1 accessory gene regulator B family protein [Clostridium beijerinckii]MBN7582025.1 accessory gene regulator B family protein [Clostridium beijerinckii]MBN7586885.1 accessory gene regulator B family protein [Clostridium beijerinckii]MBO0523089.1 accessory gene regulator B family protein [Clostridium beijerinckii]MZK52384.1 accessory regulator AgrB [Clostridium beijerinckii]
MIKLISTFITRYLEENNSSLIKTDLLKIQYTLEVILGDLTKLIILLLIFWNLNEVPFFLLSFAILISTRPLWGGIHCKSFNSCLIFSLVYFIVILLYSRFCPKLNINFYIVFFIISFIITLAFAPCDNEKRPINNKTILKILSLISLTFWGILFFKLSNLRICNCIFASILLQIVQIIIVNVKKGGLFNAKIYKYFFSHTS